VIHLAIQRSKISLGETLHLKIEAAEPGVETRLWVRHEGVLYTRPWRDWQPCSEDVLFPEAPGRYRLVVEWRSDDGRGGRSEVDFAVSPTASGQHPVETRMRDRSRLWAPTQWEGEVLGTSERAQLLQLERLLAAGDVFYDIGANLGVYSMAASRRVGSGGRVYSFEANPVCVQFLRSNRIANGADNVEILPVALLDKEGHTPFTLNYGSTQLGVARSSPHYANKGGHEIWVATAALDDLAGSIGLADPQVVKIDVEGAEALVVAGMRGILDRHQPALLLELHGLGCADATLRILDEFGYRYCDASNSERFASGAEVCRYFGDQICQVVAHPARAAS